MATGTVRSVYFPYETDVARAEQSNLLKVLALPGGIEPPFQP